MSENSSLCLKDLLNEKPIVISQLLLKHYADIDMDEVELVVVLQLLRFRECLGQTYPTIDELQKSMTLGCDQIRATLARLIEKGLISVVHSSTEKYHGKSSYVLEPLWDKLLNVWQSNKVNASSSNTLSSENLKSVYGTFEKEFGRYLSPIESSKIVQWCTSDGFSSDIILEALERAVLQGALSFKYIDSILKTWDSLQLRTIEEINNYEKQFKEKRKVKNVNLRPKQKPHDKFSQIYVT
ncbi:DnaD domain-containing protein [Desulfitibacter alkalitolerans]|uniref:DnaD domain-containing protein n=1 Tax=Desulfitibacter alkalitolerans TaxID=264641 RepID=UPI0004870522|nr:DnaD domain protein [Desulfitibacter alkalitolerans]